MQAHAHFQCDERKSLCEKNSCFMVDAKMELCQASHISWSSSCYNIMRTLTSPSCRSVLQGWGPCSRPLNTCLISCWALRCLLPPVCGRSKGPESAKFGIGCCQQALEMVWIVHSCSILTQKCIYSFHRFTQPLFVFTLLSSIWTFFV